MAPLTEVEASLRSGEALVVDHGPEEERKKSRRKQRAAALRNGEEGVSQRKKLGD
jgi:hypothetical protein